MCIIWPDSYHYRCTCFTNTSFENNIVFQEPVENDNQSVQEKKPMIGLEQKVGTDDTEQNDETNKEEKQDGSTNDVDQTEPESKPAEDEELEGFDYCIRRGVVLDWDKYERFLKHVFDKLQVDTSQTQVIFIISDVTTMEDKTKLVEVI